MDECQYSGFCSFVFAQGRQWTPASYHVHFLILCPVRIYEWLLLNEPSVLWQEVHVSKVKSVQRGQKGCEGSGWLLQNVGTFQDMIHVKASLCVIIIFSSESKNKVTSVLTVA